MVRCSACGQENPGGARFCNACGAALVAAAPPAREVRKTVTVVFCDVTGSTALGERLDPESLRRVMARYFEAMRLVIERHGGTVEKFIGDAVMAIFGVPVLHEDDALRAVRAACEMRAVLVPLNDELERDYGTTLALRTGVNTGEVVTGTEERLATGDAVNVAARLEQAAQPGEILVGPATVALVRDAVEIEPLEPLELKGKRDRLPASRLLSVRAGAAGFLRRDDSPMVGRARERQLLEGAFAGVVGARACNLFTVLGAAGVGKSRLATEFLASAEATVVQGRCLSYGEGITYWPVIEVVKRLLGENPGARLGSLGLDGAARSAILNLVGGEGPATSSEEIAWAVRSLLEAAANERPLVVVFDDIHWGEPTFLDLIEHVADLSRDVPLLVLCLARPELRERRPAWGGGMLNSTTVLLEPLSAAETDELIAALLGEAALDDALRARIGEAADGNPLFVEEMLVMVRESPNGVVQVPPTIQALLAARLDQLDTGERSVLERGAVEGKTFHRGSVEALASEEPELGTRLVALVRKELIRPERALVPGEDAYRFRHQLFRDAAYEALPKAVRAGLHERFADWLEQRADSVVEHQELRGYHLEQAFRYRSELGELDEHGRELSTRAGKHLAEAGRRALDRGDASAGSSLLGRAVDLLPRDDPARRELLPELGHALTEAGELERAQDVLSAAIDEAAAAGDARLEAFARVRRAYVGTFTGEKLKAALVEAQAAAGALERFDDQAMLAQAHWAVGVFHFWLGDCAAAERALRRALDHARRGGRSRDEGEVLSSLVMVARHGATPVPEAIRLCETTLEQARGSHSKLEAQALLSAGVLSAMRGTFDEARAAVRQAGAITRDLARLDWAGGAMEWARVELLADDPAAAELVAREGYEELDRLGDMGYLSTIAPILARAVYLQGRHEEAEQLTRVSEGAADPDDVSSQSGWRSVRALALASRGRTGEAVTLARSAVSIMERTDMLDSHAQALLDLAEVLRLGGRASEAATPAAEALRLWEQKGNLVSAEQARRLLDTVTNLRSVRSSARAEQDPP